MIRVPDVFKGDEDFWVWNPDYIMIFDSFYKRDKTKDKNRSSSIMWALYYKLHPDSAFYNMEKKEEFIRDKYLKDPRFKWSKYVGEEELFKSTILTVAERGLVEWDETMMKRGKWLKDQEYDMDNAKDLDAIVANTAKLYQLLGKVKKDFEQEKFKRGKANKPLSASDAQRI